MKSEFVLMDFDGVIADTFDLCFGIVSKANPAETEDGFRQRFVGGDGPQGVVKLTSSAGIDFFKEYSDHILEQPLANGMEDALEYIGENFTLILVTASISAPVKRYLKHHDLAKYFSAIFCDDVHTSKTEKIHIIHKHYKAEPSECVFVTDSLADIKEASAAEVPSIGVTWGYHDEEMLQRGNLVTIIDYPSQLKGAIEETLDFSGEYDE